jgi:hypothetical protein
MSAMTMSASLVSTRVVAKAPVSKASKRVAVVASAGPVEGRRAALVGLTAAVAATARSAFAITIPSQANTGGVGRENGKPTRSSNASMESYTLTGTAKTGHSPKEKFGTLAAVRAQAEAEAALSATPVVAKK